MQVDGQKANCFLAAAASSPASKDALQVSQGIGTSIYAPFRLGTPPEAVLVSLEARRIG